MRKEIYLLLLLILLTCCCSGWATDKDVFHPLPLTSEEKQWLKEHPVIRVANEMDWAPFDFNEKGIPKGMAIDYIRLLAQKIGIKLKFVYGHSWSELLELFKQRKIDLMPVLYVNDERKEFTLYTQPYHEAKLGIFTNKDATSWDGNLLNKRVGIERSHGSIPIIKKRFPDIKLIEFDTKPELVQNLGTKKLDAIIGNPLVFYYHAKEMQINTIQLSDFIAMTEDEQLKTSLHIGVRKDWPILRQIIQKAMKQTSEKEMDIIKSKWTEVTVIQKIDWDLTVKIIGTILLILLFLLYNNRKLKSMVKAKTADLEKLNESLEHKVEERTAELVELNKELESLNYGKNKFFSILSHDLRTPVSNIISVCDLAKDNPSNSKELFLLINESAKGTYTLLENLLNWAKAESGQLTPSPMDMKVVDVIKELLIHSKHIASRKNIQIRNKVDESATIYADYDMTNTILRNLLSNAIKFTADAGTIEIYTEQKDKMVELSIRDNGIGIEAEAIPKLFDIDSTYSRSGTNAELGSGLGLKLCKEFVSINGGDIWVESIIGQGSTFTIALPRSA